MSPGNMLSPDFENGGLSWEAMSLTADIGSPNVLVTGTKETKSCQSLFYPLSETGNPLTYFNRLITHRERF